MKAALLLLALASGCSSEPKAWGALKLDPGIDVATEVEVVKSRRVVEAAERELQLISPRTIEVKRRYETSIIDVTVRAKNPTEAQAFCNGLMSSYINLRHGMRLEANLMRLQRLEELDAGEEAAKVRLQLEADRGLSDVVVLEPCVLVKR